MNKQNLHLKLQTYIHIYEKKKGLFFTKESVL